MKTIHHLLALSICTAFLLGCGHKASDGHAEGHSAHAEAAHGSEAKQAAGHGEHAAAKADHAAHAAKADHAAKAGHGDEGPKLSLNNGEKWPMDDHTRAALGKLEARLKAGPASDDVAGHHALGRDLDAEVKALIQGCTMKGAAHDQLHVWLMAFIPAVGALQEGDDLAALRTRRTALDGHLSAARAHFR